MFATGKKGLTWYDIGDPAAAHFVLGDLTADANWHDLDISSIVPQGTKYVILALGITDDVAGNGILIRKKGNSNQINIAIVTVQAANKANYASWMLELPTTRLLQYYMSNVVYTDASITVVKYGM